MKRTITIILLLICNFSFATNYYFSSSSGNDTYTSTQAQSSSTPWQSISKLNSFFTSLAPGDNVLFKRGDSWYGNITILKSGTSGHPITIGAYGTGAKPIITGFTTISSGWTNEGGGIYSKVITSAAQTNMVTINGVQYAMGRYPDASAGWLTYTGFSGNTKIWSTGLGTSPNWTGAEVVIKNQDWQINRNTVNSQVVDTVNYTSLGTTANPQSANYGFFFQNDLRTLTTYGEWYHNTATGKFYMYFGGSGPTTEVIKVATVNNVISNTSGYSYVTLDGLDIQGSISDAVYYTYSMTHDTIQNSNISFAGAAGITIYGGDTATNINNNNISYCTGKGYTGVGTRSLNSQIYNNTISYIGHTAGSLGQGLGTQSSPGAINSTVAGAYIHDNRIKGIGYNGIYLAGGVAQTVQNNFIDSTCTQYDDGGGIYTSGAQTPVRIIDHNIITNVIGNSQGTNNSTSLSNGIYLDEYTSNVKVTNNTIAHIGYAGIKLHKASSNTVTDNLSYDNAVQIDWTDWVGNSIRSNSVSRNIFFTKTATQYVLDIYSVTSDQNLYGTIDSNYYARPIDDSLSFFLRIPSYLYVTKTLAQWKSITSLDAHSKKTPKTIASTSELDFQYNATGSPVIYYFNGYKKIVANGTSYNDSYTIPAWGSVILSNNRF